jgi:hypothetical protein
LIQQAYYNGWKSVHGLKHQTVDSAFGLAIDIYGPTSLRKNDVTLLRESKINERVQRECQTLDYEYAIFGDSAYRTDTHLRSYMPGNSIEARRWNGRMKSVRISIEWSYMVTASLFKYVGNHDKLRLMQNNVVSRIYITCTLLRNFYTILYGSQISNNFNILFPNDFIETYIHKRNIIAFD